MPSSLRPGRCHHSRSKPSHAHYLPVDAQGATSFVSDGLGGATRVVDTLAMAANLLLVGMLAARLTRYRSIAGAVLPPALLLLAPDAASPHIYVDLGWLPVHEAVASEPVF